MNKYTLMAYNSEKFDFVKMLKDLFNVQKLEDINEPHDELFKVGDDSKTSYHSLFYNKYREGWPEMEKTYEGLIAESIAPLYKEDFLYQKFPTLRVHLPKNVAVGAFHNDAEFHHPPGEMNFIIPLTMASQTASCWLESAPGKKDFSAMTMIPGFMIKFDGNRLTHGNKVNKTGRTRVSMDFRILPLSMYDESNTGESITRNTKFKEGQYYKRFTHGH